MDSARSRQGYLANGARSHTPTGPLLLLTPPSSIPHRWVLLSIAPASFVSMGENPRATRARRPGNVVGGSRRPPTVRVYMTTLSYMMQHLMPDCLSMRVARACASSGRFMSSRCWQTQPAR